jgi:hypothetical protein
MSSDRSTAYTPGFEHDIFISYASVDNEPELGQQGWVSTFYELLSTRLARLLGRRDGFSIWMDSKRLDGTFLVTPGLEMPLKKTALMVALLSPGYLKSPWCPWEREVFLKSIGLEAGDCARVFVVELERLEPERHPKEFADRLLYKFWIQGALDKYPRLLVPQGLAADPEYRSRMDSLARDLVKVLERMKKDAQAGEKPGGGRTPSARAVGGQPQATVYLAEATEDLDPLWWKVKSYLEQQQIEVLPRQELPRDPDACRQAVMINLADADLFVQLLSGVPGRKFDELSTKATLQHACARETGLPVLQWRDPALGEQELAEVEWAAHRELLDGPDVQAVHIEEFKQEILRTLERLRAERDRQERLAQKSQEAAEGKSNEKFVFIVADAKDGAVAQSIFEYVDQQGYPCGLPIALEDQTGAITPADIRQDFEDNVRLADGTVIVYGHTPVVWYRSQLSEVRKIHAQLQREGKPKRVGLFVAPPPKQVRMRPPGVYEIPGEAGIDEQAFQSFLQLLLERDPRGGMHQVESSRDTSLASSPLGGQR